MSYVGGSSKPAGCIFCLKAQDGQDPQNYVLSRGPLAYVLMNVYPYNNGHLMIAPYRHIGDLGGLAGEELADMMHLAQESLAVLGRSLRPEGFNLGFNQGKAAGAGIDDHIHLHIVPRWMGDTNFMPVVGTTKVLPESLDATYARLRPLYPERSRDRGAVC